MSRTYNFWSRTEAGIANQPRVSTTTSNRSRAPVAQVQGPTAHIMSSATDTDQPTALYSDVAAARPPSPRREREAETVVARDNSDRLDSEARVESNTTSNLFDTNSSYEGEHHERNENNSPWTTVTHKQRRAKSLSSLDRARIQGRRIGSLRREDTHEQAQNVAVGNIAVQQKQLRQEQLPRDDPVSSAEEGLSRPKGKGIDPREWGNVNISRESLDIEAQAAAFESIKKRRHGSATRQPRQTKPKRKGKSGSKRTDLATQLPAESRPVNQIAKDSYLGAALRNVNRDRHPHPRKDGSPDPSNPSSGDDGETSETDSSDELESGTSSDSSSASEHHRRKTNQHGRNHRRRRTRSSSRKKPKSLIKPIAPKEYDGQADARSYHRFVRESGAYLRDGRVKKRRQVFLLSYYLTGKAYDFYTQRVASDDDKWTLKQFYEELFNHCFPIDYRMQLRRKLAKCHQNDKSIAEYVHELHELFNMIGDVSERDRVLKFWNGTRPIIQKGLWRDNLNPETSPWDRVIAQAEISKSQRM